MSDLQFNPQLQISFNGPLTEEFQNRIIAARGKHRLTYGNIAEWAGLSSSFLRNVTAYEGVNIGTERVAQLADAIEKIEAAESRSDVAALFPDKDKEGSSTPSASPATDTIEFALSTLRRHGLGVILVAGTSVAVPGAVVSA